MPRVELRDYNIVMLEALMDNYGNTALLYAATVIFVFAVVFELIRRFNAIQQQKQNYPLSDRMEKAIHYFEKNKKKTKITNDIYQELTGISDATATRDLDKLEELGFLEQRGKSRGTYYLPTQKIKKHASSHNKKRLTLKKKRLIIKRPARKTAHNK